MVILSRNPMYSILFLILCFCNVSCVLLSLELEYLPIVFLVIYVGAIAVLFIFVIMTLNLRLSTLKESSYHFIPVGFLLFVFFLLSFNFICRSEFVGISSDGSILSELSSSINDVSNFSSTFKTSSNMQSLGFLAYSEFWPVFILSSYILLLAMIGAINLTLKKKFEAKITAAHLQHNLHNF